VGGDDNVDTYLSLLDRITAELARAFGVKP